jgi:hypothetical protein
LLVVSHQCAATSAVLPANLDLEEENLRGYILLLSAHFQGFCRDLYSECAQVLSALVGLPVRSLFQEQLTANLKLDAGNPNIDNLKKDFKRFGFSLEMAAADPANHVRLAHLALMNRWRNIAAHQGVPLPGGLPSLGTVQAWEDSCNGLAASLDQIMYNRLLMFLGRPPWTP